MLIDTLGASSEMAKQGLLVELETKFQGVRGDARMVVEVMKSFFPGVFVTHSQTAEANHQHSISAQNNDRTLYLRFTANEIFYYIQ